jgi:hypothetical protein
MPSSLFRPWRNSSSGRRQHLRGGRRWPSAAWPHVNAMDARPGKSVPVPGSDKQRPHRPCGNWHRQARAAGWLAGWLALKGHEGGACALSAWQGGSSAQGMRLLTSLACALEAMASPHKPRFVCFLHHSVTGSLLGSNSSCWRFHL